MPRLIKQWFGLMLFVFSWTGLGLAAPVVRLSISRPFVLVGAAQPITITAQITGGKTVPRGVTLLQVDDIGNALNTLGVMQDAGGGKFTLAVAFSSVQPGRISLQAAAVFPDGSQPVKSPALSLPVFAASTDCPFPWSNVTALYGTATLNGNGTASVSSGGSSYTLTANQQGVFGILMEQVSATCSWLGRNSSGAVSAVASVNDTFSSYSDGSTETFTFVGAGPGLQPEAGLFFVPPVYQFDMIGAGINITYTQTPPTFSDKQVFGVGPDISPPNPNIPADGLILSGTTVFSAAPLEYESDFPVNWTFTWNLSPIPDDSRCKPCEQDDAPASGSTLAFQNQSLGESIPIVGTSFFLHYQSDRAPNRAGADTVATSQARGLGGWTLNVQHAMQTLLQVYCMGGGCTPYSVEPKALFLGDGRMRSDADVQAAVSLNNKLYITSEDGNEVYVFANGLHTQTVRPLTGAVLYTFGYDTANQLVTVTDANGNVTTIQRDSTENATAIISPYGQKTMLAISSDGFLSEVTDPVGLSTKLTYATGGLLASLTDPAGNVYSFTYDPYGRLLTEVYPDGGLTSLARADQTSGYTVTATTKLGRTSAYRTAFGNTTSSTTQQSANTGTNGLVSTAIETQQASQLSDSTALPDGTTYSDTMGPDPRWGIQVPVPSSTAVTTGDLTMTASASRAALLSTPGDPFTLTTQTDTAAINGRTYTSVFSTSNLTYAQTTPAGRTQTLTLDSQERLASAQLGVLPPAQFAYDNRGRLGVITRDARVTTFGYDTNGNLSSITDALNFTTKFAYDADGRLLTQTLPDSRVISYAYDANGNLATITPPGKPSFSFFHTSTNLLSAAGSGALSSTKYSYNTDRQITTVTRPDGKTIGFRYDSAGRRISVATPTATIDYTYSPISGHLSTASISGGEGLAYSFMGSLPTQFTWTGTVAGSVSRAYDNNFWLASQSINGGNTIAYSHDADGLLITAGALSLVRDPQDGLVTGTTLNAASDSLTYNSFGELSEYNASAGGGTIYNVRFTRDNLGRIVQRAETIQGASNTYAYTYDPTGRLTQVSKNGTTTSTYTYGSNSDRVSAVTSGGNVSATYDAQDRMLTYGNNSYTYTPNGELTSKTAGGQTTAYQYDVLGNLLAVTLPSGTAINYTVDAENRRVGKSVKGALQAGFLYDRNRIVAQLNAGGAIVSRFVYGTRSNTPDYMVRGGATYRIFSDQLGSPRLVVNASSGQVAERIDYDEFGNITNDTNPGFQPFGFAGGLYDQDTKLVRFGARDYDAGTGRWTAKDPILFVGGDTNLYAYVLNDPIDKADRTGLQGEDCTCEANHDGWDELGESIIHAAAPQGMAEIGAGNVIGQVAATIVEAVFGYVRIADLAAGGSLIGNRYRTSTMWGQVQDAVNGLYKMEWQHLTRVSPCVKQRLDMLDTLRIIDEMNSRYGPNAPNQFNNQQQSPGYAY